MIGNKNYLINLLSASVCSEIRRQCPVKNYFVTLRFKYVQINVWSIGVGSIELNSLACISLQTKRVVRLNYREIIDGLIDNDRMIIDE